jgi:uncharacterized protein
MLQPIITDNIDKIKQLCLQHSVKELYAFGSVCTPRFTETSDVDLLIKFDDNLEPLKQGKQFWDFLFAVEKVLNRSVDLVTEKSLTNPYFIEELNEMKTPIYG